MSTVLGDATLLWIFQALLGAAFCWAELNWWFTKQTGAYASVQRGPTSWSYLDFAFGIIAVNVLQIINSADDTVKFKVLMSTFDLGVMIRLFFFNDWSKNKIIGFVSQVRSGPEKDQEIARLEAELSRVEAERESARAALTKATEEFELERVERAKAESTARTLQAELTELRVESRKTLETVTAWVERASRAEARLEELAKGAGGQGDRS